MTCVLYHHGNDSYAIETLHFYKKENILHLFKKNFVPLIIKAFQIEVDV